MHKPNEAHVINFCGHIGTLREIAEAIGVSYTCISRRYYYRHKSIQEASVGVKDTGWRPRGRPKVKIKKERSPKPPPIKFCPVCGSIFEVKGNRRFCCSVCQKLYKSRRAREKAETKRLLEPKYIEKKCSECGKEFSCRLSVSNKKTCSAECGQARKSRQMAESAKRKREAGMEERRIIKDQKKRMLLERRETARLEKLARQIKVCLTCGSEYHSSHSTSKFCRKKCAKRDRIRRRRKDSPSPHITHDAGSCRECGKELPTPRPAIQALCSKSCSKREYRRKIDGNPHHKMKKRISSRLRELLKKRNIYKTQSTSTLIGCTPKEIALHLERQFDSRMTWENYGVFGWHVDHIVPCAAFCLEKEDHQRLCFNYRNLRPLWRDQNIAKAGSLMQSDIESLDSKYLESLQENGIIKRLGDGRGWYIVSTKT